MERLNDNEVKEVARMQSLIDGYEAFILAVHVMILGNTEVSYPIFTDTPLDKDMNKIYRWVKEQIDNNNDNGGKAKESD